MEMTSEWALSTELREESLQCECTLMPRREELGGQKET